MSFKINGEEKSFSKVTFSLGGNSGRGYGKLGYNVKIRNDKDDLFGARQFRLRGEARDPSFIRNKIGSDIYNKMGIPTSFAGFTRLYVNDQFFGFYSMHDAIKQKWIEREFGEVDTKHLYKCGLVNQFLSYIPELDNCENEDDSVTDRTEWTDLLKTIDAAQTREDFEKFLDVDLFIKNMVAEWLVGSWDRFNLVGHNYYMYKNPESGKWMFIPYDFDSDLGSDMYGGLFYNKKLFAYVYDWPFFTYDDYAAKRHITDVLVRADNSTFNRYAQEFVRDVFNPAILFKHIDEVKKLIDADIVADKTEDPTTGLRPGRINVKGKTDEPYEVYQANSEFTTVSADFTASYGLKRWILDKFRHVCGLYNMDCSFAAEYLEGGSFTYEVDSNLENAGMDFSGSASGELVPVPTDGIEPQSTGAAEVPSTGETETSVTTGEENPDVTIQTQSSAEGNNNDNTTTEAETCWSEAFGYKCCQFSCLVVKEDEQGAWGSENGEWCGIQTDSCKKQSEACWSIPLGYTCCQNSQVYEEDEQGAWGYEDDHWCGILKN
ncbi:coth-domain-containing protein [Neocallimastix californiae]|uniref:Coth-domain-containing protein n=1 Tax=Neocallimastix californiae TaxID=1754190 RepID=A0A1Y2D791_9FUNG|nr:coth-domain-containing protein [Neocallimastix californiae]|eukprot:ORY55024.1 coth-domain-containing protein [Neocallimastix californiae]